MSQLRTNVHGRRRISALLFSLLRRLDGWIERHHARQQASTARSSALYFEPLEARILLSADLVAGSLAYDGLNPVIPGEPLSAHFQVYRPDSDALTRPIRIEFYASSDAALDPGNEIIESDESNNQSIASQPFALDFAVGQLPGRNPLPSLSLSDGSGFTLSIAGPGVARLIPNGNGYDLSLTGTDSTTRVDLAGSGDERIVLSAISASGPLGSLIAPRVSLTGAANFTTLNSLTLAETTASASLDGGSLGNLKVSGDARSGLRLSGAGASGFVLGSVQVGGAIGGLWSINGRANSITAQTTSAGWRANIANPLTQLVVSGDASGQFAAAALQMLQVGGSLKAMTLRIGANLGSDAAIGGSGSAADHFGAGTLARLRVSGNVEDSLIVIGIDPRNGGYLDGDDQQLATPTYRVQELLVGGQLKGDTHIIAPAFPASVRIDGVTLNPKSIVQLATTPPDLIAPTLSAALVDDSGSSPSDHITRDPSVRGQALDAGAVSRLLAALDPSGTPTFVDLSQTLQSDGSFVLSAALLDSLTGSALADGNHALRLVAEDAAGNRSAPAEISFQLDRSAPAVSLELDPAFDTGESGDRQTTAERVDLVVHSEDGARIELLDALGQTLADAVAGATGDVRFTAIALLLGENRYSARATDTAGNSRFVDLTLTRIAPDTTAPTLTAQLAHDSGASTDDRITNDPTVTGNISDASPIAALRAGFGNDPAGFVSILDTLHADSSFTLDAARLATLHGGPLPDGSHTLRLIASDSAGNSSAISELSFTLDTTAPSAPDIDLIEASDSGSSHTDNLTNDSTPTLSLSGETASTLRLARDGRPLTALPGPGGEITLDPLTDGDHSFSATAEDLAGNLSQAGALQITIDTTAPILASFGLDPASDTGTLGDLQTSASNAMLVGQTEAGASVRLASPDQQTTADSGGAFGFTDLPLALGDNVFAIVLTDAAGNSTQTSLTVTRVSPPSEDTTPPALAATLANDTGRSNSDGISSDATISGVATDDHALTQLRAGFGTNATDFVNILDTVQADGRFTLDSARLAAINGGALPDGSYTLHLQAEDGAGNATTASLEFTLDSQAPAAPAFGLSPASDTGVVGDGDTEAARVTLIGTSEANADLLLVETGSSGVASNSGSFFLPDRELALGDNAFTLRATDAAGNVAQANRVFHRSAGTASSDLVLQWNDIALTAIRLDASAPPVATRGLAMLSIAVLDTVNACEGTPGFYVSRSAPAGASLDAALAAAAQRVLTYLYPGQQASFDAALAAALANVPDGTAKSDGIALGHAIADDIIALRRDDGFDDFVDFTSGTGAGQWQATAPTYAIALLPQWADLQPFAMSSASEFRPAPPPALDSATYTADFEEVKALGSATGSTRSAEQTQITRFWADGAGTDTPPGHWNRIAATLANTHGNSLAANARLFAQLNVALADASIAAWDAKYHYTAWRPITAIRAADSDGNDATAADTAWTSLLITPPFPEYVSGHSTYSGAAETILASAFGADSAFTITSDSLPGVQRSFASVQDAAEEAGRSRIYGGIHFEFSNQAGLVTGRAIGQQVLATFATSTDTQAPKLLLDQASGLVTASNLSVSGRVLDSLSGVATLQGAIDAATPAAIAFDADGRFSVESALDLDGSADGAHTLTLTAIDARGNSTAPLDFSFTLDTRAPLITLASLANGDTLSTAARLTGSANPTGSPLTSLAYAFDGGKSNPLSFDAASGQFDSALDLSRISAGAHTLNITATDAAGNSAASTLNVTLVEPIPLAITRTTPSDGANDIGATFRPQVFFSRAVAATTLTDDTFYATDSSGAKLAATIVPAQDGSFAWLFLSDPMPGASTITIHVVGDGILAQDGGQALDADGDGTAGGTLETRFTTVSVTPIAGTTITGRLFDPGDDLKPMTFDDVRAGPDGVLHTADDVFLHPIAHAKVYILGLENNVVYTDANGYFHLDQVPAGDVKLAIDGRTATNAPAGTFYPEMVMDLTIEVGYDNTVMGSMGTREAMAANEDRREVYLPRLQTAILQSVSSTANTEIGVDAVSAPNLTDVQRAQLKLEVQPGTLLDANGEVMTGGQVGISTVPPELVRDMLPPGVLQHTFDITIQAPGVAAFATPLEITFPNVFDAAPGEKLNFLSFDHTTGKLVIEGTATVSADGKSVTTDPGMGITKPGWHGLTPPGGPVGPPPPCPNVCSCPSSSTGTSFASIAATATSDCETEVRRFVLRKSLAALGGLLATGAGCIAAGTTVVGITACVGGIVVYADWVYDITQEVDKKRQDCDSCVSAATNFEILATGSEPTFDARMEYLHPSVSDPILDRLFEIRNLVIDVLSPYAAHPELTPLPVWNQVIASFTEAFEIAGGDPVGYVMREIAAQERLSDAPDGESPGASRSYPILYAAFIVNPDASVTEIRGQTTGGGQYSVFVPAGGRVREVRFFDPVTNSYGMSVPYVSGSVRFKLPHPTLVAVAPDGFPDFDSDGISNAVELVYGTNVRSTDSDGDGISDAAELHQGLDPLGGRSLPTGIVATLPLQGEAKAVTLEGSTTSAETQTAYVATGSNGLAIVDASSFQQPLVLSQLDLTGDSVDVAVDSRLGIAAVAAGSALHLINIADATAPVLQQSIVIPAVQVETANGIAYVAAGNGIESYSLLTGELLQVLPLGAASGTSLARDGTTLYALDASNTLRAIDLASLLMSVLGSLALPAGGGKVFVGNGIAYVGAGNGTTGGFVTANVSNPAAMTVLSGVDANNVQGQAIAANGSGLGVSVGNTFLFGIGDVASVDVLDLRDASNTGNFLTRFNLPARPLDIAIGAGIAFVADGTGGLQVVNYLPFDNQGQAPTISLSAPTADRDPTTPGIQALEGSPINVKLDVADDQQVRNVELLVDGQVVANDVSFPWTAAVALPTLSATTTSTTIQARATDTGGNTTLSDPLVIDLVPDTFAPTLVSSNVADGSRHAQTFRTLRLSFNEALDATGITAEHFRLLDASDNVILPTDVALSANGRMVTLTLPTLAQGAYRLVIDGNQVSDRAGNAFGSAAQTISTFDIVEATIEWTAPRGGDWNNAANWDLGRVPDATDFVLINGSPGATVNINGEQVRVQGIDSFSGLTLNSASLTVESFLTVHDGYHLTLNNGAIQRGTINLEGTASLQVASGTRSSRLDAVTVAGDIDLSNSTLHLKDVVIDGRVSLPNTGYYDYASLAFEGTQTLGGHAEIVSYDTGGQYYNTLEMLGEGELTLGADVRVHGSALNIGNAITTGAVTLQRLINHGTIEADTGTVQVVANAFQNEGVVKASGGSLLSLSNLQPNAGVIQASDGGLVSVAGNFTNLANGTVRLGIGGTSILSDGRLNVTGNADLDGTLSVFTSSGFVPTVGQTYTLISFASRTGTFATLRDENPDDGVTFAEIDASLDVTLNVVAG